MTLVAICCDTSNTSSTASSSLTDKLSTICIAIEGRIHHARGNAVAACHVAKLLRHRRHRSGDADGLAVRGDHFDSRGGAKVERGAWSIHHTKHRAFWRYAPGRCDSQCAMAGALEYWSAAGSFGSRGGNLRPHCAPAGTPSGGLSPGAGRLAVAYSLAAGLLHRHFRPSDAAPGPSGAGTVRHRCGNGATPVHRHPQRVG